MEADAINKNYWSKVPPEKILSGLCYPGEELTGFLAPQASVLDVGCGNGKISEYLHERDYLVTGIDINTNALDENRSRNPGITYQIADITERLPFEDSSFDCVVVPYVFVSIIDREKEDAAAAELVRVLKTSGILWICEATYSEDYTERYKVGKEATGLDNVALSFSKGSQEVKTVERVIRHYSVEEIDTLFKPLEKLSSKQVAVVSPSSGMTVQTIVSVYRKV